MSAAATCPRLVVALDADARPVVQLHAAPGVLLPLTVPDEPLILALDLARLGYVVAAGCTVPQRPEDHPGPLVPLPAGALDCPPWCTTCASTPDLFPDVPTGRAVLAHRGTVARVGPHGQGWSVHVVRHVLLSDPPEHGRPGVELVPEDPTRCALSAPDALALAALVTTAAATASAPRPGPAHPPNVSDPLTPQDDDDNREDRR